MKIVKDVLYLETKDLVESGVSESYLWKVGSVKTNGWNTIKDPIDARRTLFEWEGLKPNYKAMVKDKFGDPYNAVARTPILKMVELDPKAQQYYRSYKYSLNGFEVSLEAETVTKYTRGAAWLDLVAKVMDDRTIVTEKLGIGIADFYEHTCQLIGLEKQRGADKKYTGTDQVPMNFPSVYQRLRDKTKLYKAMGWDALIDPMFGNKNGSKLGKAVACTGAKMEVSRVFLTDELADSMRDLTEITPTNVELLPENAGLRGGFDHEIYRKQIAIIRTTLSSHKNLNAAQAAKIVNSIFEKKGWKSVSRATISKYINEQRNILTPGRNGMKKYNADVAMQMKRSASAYPMLYWTLDGWVVELGYQEMGKNGVEYKRLTAVVVLDVYNKYPVGYAIGVHENAELIREANRNALQHTATLLGQCYKPWQVQSDNYAISQLTPFYQAMAHLHTPAAVGNSKAKVIEPYFNYINSQYCQMFDNWTGHNVTAKQRNQVNAEFSSKIASSWPDKAGVIRQIERIIGRERELKREEYMQGWAALQQDRPQDVPEVLGAIDYLMVMGQPIGKTDRVTGKGIVKQIDGVKYTYDSFDPQFRMHANMDWQIVGDKEDLRKVLAVSTDGRVKVLLEEKRVVPMDIRSTTEEDRQYRAAVDQYNKERKAELLNNVAEDAPLVHEVIDSLALGHNEDDLALKMMFTVKGQQKERMQKAKELVRVEKQQQRTQAITEAATANNWEAQQAAWLESKIDFSEY